MSCSSSVQPLEFIYANQTLTTDGRAQSRGIAVQVGTPPQLFALTPTSVLNNTFLNNIGACGSDENTTCIQEIGGGFNAGASSTFRGTTADAWNGSQEVVADQFVNSGSVYFNDLITISSSETLPGFPLLLEQQQGSGFYAALGLGSNSTFINRLVDADYAPSRSWSMFTGIYTEKSAGSLIIGGYADKYYEGELYTQNVTSSVQIEGADYNLATWQISSFEYVEAGKTVNLMSDSTSLTMAVDPYYPILTVPEKMLYAWGNATGGTWSEHDLLYTYEAGNVPTGNVTVTLANGLKTTIPNNALFDPPAYDNGVLAAYRNGTASTVYSTFTDWRFFGASDTPAGLFGVPYAAMVYLIRDYERQTASIANANQAAQIGGDVTAICPLKGKSGNGSSHQSNTGAIAGGVVGGVLGLALIAALIWFLLRRRKNRRSSTLR